MQILKVLNNNVALASNSQDQEVIIMGRGISFGKKSGDTINEDSIEKVFVLQEQQSIDVLSNLYNDISPQILDALLKIVDVAEQKLALTIQANIYISLADHINFAIERNKKDLAVQNPLDWEVRKFYPNEYQVGKQSLKIIEKETGEILPLNEATSIALHFVNAGKVGTTMEYTMKLTKIVGDIVNIVRNFFGVDFDEESISYNRFITHIQFFAQRVVQGIKQTDDDLFLYDQVQQSYPKAFKCSNSIRNYIESVHHFDMSSSEQVYLAIHIQRIINTK